MLHSFHHHRGGDTTYTHDLQRLLSEVGHDVVPFSMRHPDNTPSIYEARFPAWLSPHDAKSLRAQLHIARKVMWSSDTADSLRSFIKDTKPDVAHIQHVHHHLTPAVLDPLNAAGIPVVWTVHDYELICPSGHLFTQNAPCERCKGGDYRNAIRFRCKWGQLRPSVAAAIEQGIHRLKRVWHRVDRFLCPSRFLAEKLCDFGVPSSRVQVLPNPMDLRAHPPNPQTGEGWLYAGRLAPEKGVNVLLDAARMLPNHPLTICGTGPLYDTLRHQAADMPHVQFTGFLPPTELAKRIRAAQLVVVPSRWYENFPYAVLEAQAAERAVLASDIGGIPEQIDSEKDGWLVAPSDAVALANAARHLLERPALTRTLGKAARQRIAQTLQPIQHRSAIEAVYTDVRR